MKTIIKIIVGIVAASIILIVGLVALIGGAANEVQKESDESAITQADFESVKKGSSMKEVKDQLGEPEDEQVTQMEGMKDSTCIYYNQKGDIASMYQFCFDGKRLTSKSSY